MLDQSSGSIYSRPWNSHSQKPKASGYTLGPPNILIEIYGHGVKHTATLGRRQNAQRGYWSRLPVLAPRENSGQHHHKTHTKWSRWRSVVQMDRNFDDYLSLMTIHLFNSPTLMSPVVRGNAFPDAISPISPLRTWTAGFDPRQQRVASSWARERSCW